MSDDAMSGATNEDRHTAGETRRRQVLGDEYVDAAVTRASPFTAAFQQHITETAWGAVWTRPGLAPRTRSMLTIALLAGLGHHGELALHVGAAVRLGVTPAEISEVLLHTSVYAGVPAANSAFAVASAVLADLGLADLPLDGSR